MADSLIDAPHLLIFVILDFSVSIFSRKGILRAKIFVLAFGLVIVGLLSLCLMTSFLWLLTNLKDFFVFRPLFLALFYNVWSTWS